MFNEPKTITDKTVQNTIVEKFHNDPVFGGHCGQDRLFSKIREQYFWPGMRKDIKRYVSSCLDCQSNKHQKNPKPESTIVPTPAMPFDSVVIDIRGPLPRSINDNVYALTIQCELTKFLIISPLPNKEALTVAKAIMDDFVMIHGPMRVVKSDNAKEFVNNIFESLTQLMAAQHSLSTPYHPQSVGVVERNHRVLNEYLRMYTDVTGANWDIYAKFFALSWNIAPLTHQGNYTPFELVYNRKCTVPGDWSSSPGPLYNADDYVKLTRHRFQNAIESVKRFVERNKLKQKELLDKTLNCVDIRTGDWILVKKGGQHKLDKVYDGPFEVIDVIEPNVTYRTQNGEQIIHVSRVRKWLGLNLNPVALSVL